MSQFGADIFDDEPKKPAVPPSEPPRKRPQKGARRRKAGADGGAEGPADPTSATSRNDTLAPRDSEPVAPASAAAQAGEQAAKKPSRRRATKAKAVEVLADDSRSAAETAPARGEPTTDPAATDSTRRGDVDDVLFPHKSGGDEGLRSGKGQRAGRPDRSPPASRAPRPVDEAPAAPIELPDEAAHEGGPVRESGRAHDDDRDGDRRGRRRRRSRRSRTEDPQDDRDPAGHTEAPVEARGAEPRGSDDAAAAPRQHPFADAPWSEDRGDADEGGLPRDAEPVQDPFARPVEARGDRGDRGRPSRERHPSADRDRREPPRDRHPDRPQDRHRDRGPGRPHDRHSDRSRERHRDEFRDDDAPPPRLPQRDLATARRAPALPEPPPTRRAAALVDVAELMRQARERGAELAFRKLRRALLDRDELIFGLALVPPDAPRSGCSALAAAGFTLRECADAAACSEALANGLAEVPDDVERLVLAGADAGLAARTERAELAGIVEQDGVRALGAECLFVP